MDRDLLGHLPIIACVARHRSFAAAAAELGMSPSAISHAVRSVEDRLAIPLFARTTRSVSLTEAGARFVAGVEPALTDIEKTVEELRVEHGEVTGLLRIDAPSALFEIALTRILAKLAQQHRPNVRGHRCSRLRCRHQNIQGHPARYGHDAVDWVIQGHSRRLEGLSRCQRNAEVDRRFASTQLYWKIQSLVRRGSRLGTDRWEETDNRENVGYGFGDRYDGGAQFGFGRCRYCSYQRAAGTPVRPRRQP
jgi:Bacterial regulatory helix-turn-helix protein, lysR family